MASQDFALDLDLDGLPDSFNKGKSLQLIIAENDKYEAEQSKRSSNSRRRAVVVVEPPPPPPPVVVIPSTTTLHFASGALGDPLTGWAVQDYAEGNFYAYMPSNFFLASAPTQPGLVALQTFSSRSVVGFFPPNQGDIYFEDETTAGVERNVLSVMLTSGNYDNITFSITGYNISGTAIVVQNELVGAATPRNIILTGFNGVARIHFQETPDTVKVVADGSVGGQIYVGFTDLIIEPY